MADDKQKELQETVMRLETGKKQLEGLMQQGRAIENALMEVIGTIETLEGIKGKEVGSEILVPIGGDSFIKANLSDNKNVITGVGARVSLEKNIGDAIHTLKHREEDLKETMVKLRENATNINKEIESLDMKAQQMMVRAQQGK